MHGYRLVEIVETELRACTDLKKPPPTSSSASWRAPAL